MQNRNMHPLEKKLFSIAGHLNGDTASLKSCIREIKECKDIPKPNIDLQDGDGNTALMVVARTSNNLPIGKILIEEGANPDIKNNDGFYVLHFAARNNRLNIVELLIQVKADINLTSSFGSTALIGAAYSGYIDIVKALIKAGCDLEMKDKKGDTALNDSIKSGFHNRHLPTIRTLLEAGAYINQPQPLLEFLEKKHNQQKLDDAEDIYVCLSILCEQQERIREEKAAPEKSRLSEELYQKAENMLRDLPEPSSVSYKLKRDVVIEKIDEVTNRLFPTLYPQGVNQIMATYDNPIRHRLFDIQEKQKGTETGLKENERNKMKFSSS